MYNIREGWKTGFLVFQDNPSVWGGDDYETISTGNVIHSHSRILLLSRSLQPILPPPLVVYTPVLSQIWVCDNGGNPGLYSRALWQRFCETLSAVAKLFPSKGDGCGRENLFSSSNVWDSENELTALVGTVNLGELKSKRSRLKSHAITIFIQSIRRFISEGLGRVT